jgi:carbon-monoxide dehydrogenase small subunit
MKPATIKQVAMTVNGRLETQSVEPRLSLADFLRGRLQLTGTHLGCETGVCGACTVLLDGVPIRSCLVLAVSLNGRQVRTIEGFDSDELMYALRSAFSHHHGLQCGFCTPGMLIMARDLVLRLPDAGESDIRRELSGNLCRCTGYMGIIAAIQRVVCERKAKHHAWCITKGAEFLASENAVLLLLYGLPRSSQVVLRRTNERHDMAKLNPSA